MKSKRYFASRGEAALPLIPSSGNSQVQGGEKSDTGSEGQIAKAMGHGLTAVQTELY